MEALTYDFPTQRRANYAVRIQTDQINLHNKLKKGDSGGESDRI